jgi:hypothetical protein
LPITLGWSAHEGRDSLLIDGVDPGAVDQLAVRPSELAGSALVGSGSVGSELVGSGPALQPVAGRFLVVESAGHIAGDGSDALRAGVAVHFVPRFGFLRGTSYTVFAGGRVVGDIVRPGPAGDADAVVEAIYPDAAQVPLNLLRAYVQFSRPMSEGQALQLITVHRARDGAVLDGAFLDAQHELWDPSRRRLTLLLDPGRIKRGLVPHSALGYPLTEGEPIEIRVDAGFADADGLPLRSAYVRSYDVGRAIRTRVDPLAWQVIAPTAGTVEPLHVGFDRALDRALLGRCLTVVDANRSPVVGTSAIEPGDASWRFTPAGTWAVGRHALVVDATLEDLAGNSVARVFDRDLAEPADRVITAQQVSVDFDCTT